MVNYVNDTVFLYELDTLINALENVNIDSESQHGYADAGAAASGAGDTIASMKTLDDETVISTIYNLYDDDDIVIITDQISRIAQNVVAVNVVSSRATEDYSDIILENDAIIQLITMLDSANGDERTRRANLRNIFRKVQEIGNDELISYYNYPIRSMVTEPTTFVEGIHLMYQKIVEIYGTIGAPVMPSKGGSMSRKLRRKSRTTRRNKTKRNKSHHKESRRNIRKHKQTKRKHRKSKQNKKK
jgi:hypothetical protein